MARRIPNADTRDFIFHRVDISLSEGSAMVTARGNREALEEKVRELGLSQPWNHNFDLGDGCRDGQACSDRTARIRSNSSAEAIVRGYRLRGKRVIDIGCNEGFFALYMPRRERA